MSTAANSVADALLKFFESSSQPILFAGAGVQPGRIIGATDKTGSYVTDRPVKPSDVCSTVYEALGIDPHKLLLTPEGRPTHILDDGEVIKELYT